MAITLNDIYALAKAMQDADREVEKAEAVLAEKKNHFRYLQEEALPSAMQEVGLQEAMLDTGEKIKIKQEVYASITEANKQTAFKWLDDHGFGGLIKVDVVVNYGKGDAEEAVELLQRLEGEGLSASMSQGVNAQTLKAFLREQISSGSKIPLELFGARPVWQAKISKK